jgi:hypothetical protein
MTTAILATAAALFGFLFFAACGVILQQAAEINAMERDFRDLQNELDDASVELAELRCEYERSMGGTSYKHRPVNRISRMFPK